MTDLLGIDGKPIERSVDNIKQTISSIERFMFVIQNASIPAKFSPGFLEGMQFLQKMHDSLLAQLTPEELEQFKEEANPKPKPQEGVN